MCANTTTVSAFVTPIAAPGRWNWSVTLKVAMEFVDVFQEALAMRRAAQRNYHLNDE
jgi:hypothetical protein